MGAELSEIIDIYLSKATSANNVVEVEVVLAEGRYRIKE